MNYAAAKQFVSPQGMTADADGSVGLPWELENGVTAARQETWLLSFIDILALLLTLFVLLLAYQDRIPEPSDEPMTVSLQPRIDFTLQALQTFTDRHVLLPAPHADARGFAMPGEGLLPQMTAPGEYAPSSQQEQEVARTTESSHMEDETLPVPGELPVTVEAELETDAVSAAEDVERPEPGQVLTVEPPQAAAEIPAALPVKQRPADALLAAVNASPLKDRVEVSVTQDAVSLEISDNILFARSSASLSDEGLGLLEEVAGLLQTLPYRLSVEGHTDDTPIRTLRYPSNWELSSARAAAVTRKLIEKGVSPERIRAIGYGDTRPRAENTTAAGRTRNRRVTFVLEMPADS